MNMLYSWLMTSIDCNYSAWSTESIHYIYTPQNKFCSFVHFWKCCKFIAIASFLAKRHPPNMGGSEIKFDQIQHFQCSEFLSSKVRKLPSIRLYFKYSVSILLPFEIWGVTQWRKQADAAFKRVQNTPCFCVRACRCAQFPLAGAI